MYRRSAQARALRHGGVSVMWSIFCVVMTGCAAVLLGNVTVNQAFSPLPRPAFALGPVVPGNWLDQHFRVPPGGTARMDIWLGTGDKSLDYVPVHISIFDPVHPNQSLHTETIRVATTDPRVVPIWFDRLTPNSRRLVLRIAPVADGLPFLAGATKDDRYADGRLWIGPEQAFPDQDVALTIYDQIPISRWLALSADRQRDQLALFVGLQIAVVLVLYSATRRIQDLSRIGTIKLWLVSLPLGMLVMIPVASSLLIVT